MGSPESKSNGKQTRDSQEMDQKVKDMQTIDRKEMNNTVARDTERLAPCSVQVLTPEEVPKTFSDAFLNLLKKISYKGENTRYEDLHSDKPLIVVCPVSTRLEPDIDYILNGLKWSSDFITLVLHYGDESSQPGLPTATRLPDKEIYKKTEFIDMLFTSESIKLDRYKINVDAKKKIKRFLDKYYK